MKLTGEVIGVESRDEKLALFVEAKAAIHAEPIECEITLAAEAS